MDKVAQVQAEARTKALQAEHFFKELEQWETSISREDEKLKVKKAALKKAVPPVRSEQFAAKHVVKKLKGESDKTVAKEKRIKSGDYRSWDKFNVDSELKKLEEEEQLEEEERQAVETLKLLQETGEGEDDGREVLAEYELQQRMAQIEKDSGNAQFKEGKYSAAVACYTRGIEYDPASAALYANRCMAYLKLKRFEEVVGDASTAIQLDPTYIKAFQRRATAHTMLNNFDKASEDWSSVLRLDPKHKQAKKEIVNVAEHKKKYLLEQEKHFNPLKKAMDIRETHLKHRKEQPMVRIPIDEIGTPDPSDDESEVSQAPNVEIKEHRKQEETQKQLQPFAPAKVEKEEKESLPLSTMASQPLTIQKEKKRKKKKLLVVEESSSPIPTTTTPTANASLSDIPSQQKGEEKISSFPANTTTTITLSTKQEPSHQQKPVPVAITPPKNGVEFMRRLNVCIQNEGSKETRQHTAETLHQLLMSVGPTHTKKFCSLNVEAYHILPIARALNSEPERSVAAFKRLRAILSSDRIDIHLMFLTANEKEELHKIAFELGERASKKNAPSLSSTTVNAFVASLKPPM
eukprot:m.15325 g.15325  ORF g.15325 m.15325 type:complete len:577 (+) comp4456_c0_seq1:30-1760(+)